MNITSLEPIHIYPETLMEVVQAKHTPNMFLRNMFDKLQGGGGGGGEIMVCEITGRGRTKMQNFINEQTHP